MQLMRHIARQPILDRSEQTIGYELLYRAGPEATARFDDANVASRSTLDTSLLMGIEQLSGGRRVFLNCTHEFLVNEYATLVPPDKVVIEILETAESDQFALDACKRLKSYGYMIALDDFVPNSNTQRFLDYADILKIDIRKTPLSECKTLLKRYSPRFKSVAEKVETRSEYQSAREAGFTYFQGFFFCEPTLLSAREISPMRMNHVRLLKATCNTDLDFREIEEIVKTDAALCYRLLRYMNSAAFYVHSSVNSIRHALALMGEREIRKWIAVTAVSMVAEEKPREIVLSALLRARFCELLALHTRCKPYDLFIVGLFSLMDAILDEPLERILIEIEIPPEARAALLGKPIRLREVLELIQAYTSANWSECQKHREKLRITEAELADAYLASVRWVDAVAAINDRIEAESAAGLPTT